MTSAQNRRYSARVVRGNDLAWPIGARTIVFSPDGSSASATTRNSSACRLAGWPSAVDAFCLAVVVSDVTGGSVARGRGLLVGGEVIESLRGPYIFGVLACAGADRSEHVSELSGLVVARAAVRKGLVSLPFPF